MAAGGLGEPFGQTVKVGNGQALRRDLIIGAFKALPHGDDYKGQHHAVKGADNSEGKARNIMVVAQRSGLYPAPYKVQPADRDTRKDHRDNQGLHQPPAANRFRT